MKIFIPQASRRGQIEQTFLFISKVAFKLLPSINHSPLVSFGFDDIAISFTWDVNGEGSEGGIEKGVPMMKFSAFDATFNYRLSNNKYRYEESNQIEAMGAKPIEGSSIAPICCLVAHELAHVVIFHDELKNDTPFSVDHSEAWLNLYLELRKSLLSIFELSLYDDITCKDLVIGLPSKIREEIIFNAGRESHDGKIYGLTGAVEIFIEDSIQQNMVSNMLLMNQSRNKSNLHPLAFH